MCGRRGGGRKTLPAASGGASGGGAFWAAAEVELVPSDAAELEWVACAEALRAGDRVQWQGRVGRVAEARGAWHLVDLAGEGPELVQQQALQRPRRRAGPMSHRP